MSAHGTRRAGCGTAICEGKARQRHSVVESGAREETVGRPFQATNWLLAGPFVCGKTSGSRRGLRRIGNLAVRRHAEPASAGTKCIEQGRRALVMFDWCRMRRTKIIARDSEAERRGREKLAIDAEFGHMSADRAYEAESATIMREFETADREMWQQLANWPSDRFRR